MGLVASTRCWFQLGGASDLATAFSTVNSGDAWCFGAAVGFGVMFARMAYHMEELGAGEVVALTAWQMAALVAANLAWYGLDDLHGIINFE